MILFVLTVKPVAKYEFQSIEIGRAVGRGWSQALGPFIAFACLQFISHSFYLLSYRGDFFFGLV